MATPEEQTAIADALRYLGDAMYRIAKELDGRSGEEPESEFGHLPQRQQEAMEFILRNKLKTVRMGDLKRGLGIDHPGNVYQILEPLERKGYLQEVGGRPRTWKVLYRCP